MSNLLKKVKRLLNRMIYIHKSIWEYAAKTKKNKLISAMDILISGIVLGASPADYYYFDFENASFKERKTFFTARYANKLIAANLMAQDKGFFMWKKAFETKFAEFCKRESFLCEQLTYEEFIKVAKNGKVICKPHGGEQGRGIIVLEVDDDNKEQIYNRIKELTNYIVEEWIVQHPYLDAIYPDSVNPIRIQTLVKDNKVEFAGATLTIGNGKKFANASADALFALVDIKTGGGGVSRMQL